LTTKITIKNEDTKRTVHARTEELHVASGATYIAPGKTIAPGGATSFYIHGRNKIVVFEEPLDPMHRETGGYAPLPAAEPWRVGTKYGLHVYCGNRPVATFFDDTEARLAVDAVNGVNGLGGTSMDGILDLIADYGRERCDEGFCWAAGDKVGERAHSVASVEARIALEHAIRTRLVSK
jgi:hypothetical protein